MGAADDFVGTGAPLADVDGLVECCAGFRFVGCGYEFGLDLLNNLGVLWCGGGVRVRRPYVPVAVTWLCVACIRKFRRTRQGLIMLLTALCLLDSVVVSDLMFIGLFLKFLMTSVSRCWLSRLKFLGLIPSTVTVVLVVVWATVFLLCIRVQLCICCSSWPVTCGALCVWCVTLLVFLVL